MACCGSSNKFDEALFKQLLAQCRNNSEKIGLKLNNLTLEFNPNSSEWKSKYINNIFFNNSKYKRSFSWIFICKRR